MKEMFEASVDGQAYDPVKWGHHFKPAGFRTDDNADHADDETVAAKPAAKAAPAPAVKPAPVVHDSEDFDADEPAAPVAAKPAAAAAATGSRAEDILALIRSRQKSAA
jgi:hypothetical protein